MLIYFLIFFRLWATHVTVVTQGKVMKVSKGKQIQFYFNLRTDALGCNLNPSIQANEGDRQAKQFLSGDIVSGTDVGQVFCQGWDTTALEEEGNNTYVWL